MASFVRYAIYYLPPEGALARFGASWLGWDVGSGRAVAQPDDPVLGSRIAEVTRTPRKYGFHATLKPPFRLLDGMQGSALAGRLAALAATQPPVVLERLEPAALGHFLALVPGGDTAALEAFAARCVSELDDFRAPAGEGELARRRAAGLSARQEEMLQRWGYPYVMDEFRFHMTLSGRLGAEDMALVRAAVERHLPALPEPFVIDRVALVGERADGMFELVHAYTLSG